MQIHKKTHIARCASETVENFVFITLFKKHRMITDVFGYLQSDDTKDVPIVTLR